MVGLIIYEITNIIYQYIQIIGGVIGIVSLIITFWYNRKLLHYNLQALQLDKKDRKQPAIVELIRFFIVPLKEWFSDQMNKDTGEFKEFKIENLEVRPINSNLVSKYTPQSLSIPNLSILYIDFNSLLKRFDSEKKLHLKNEWDEKVQEYNKLTGTLNKKLNELVDNVRKFLDENQDVKRVYNNTEANKKYDFDVFKKELAENFYKQYRSSLSGTGLYDPWIYAGKEIFEQVIFHNKSILEEIEKLKEERKHVLKKIISILEQLQKQLRVEYDLKSSDQTSQISFISPHIR